jgi:ABC-type bacteriocin/lantibiotic exporter with double-glycine peptidase domain
LENLISQFPEGLDTRIGERGAKLSGGQRQRLAIARALYADVEVLLFDEVTNQIHASLESEIMDALNQFSDKKKTIVIVTHKIHTNFFDSIYHLDKCKLTEEMNQRSN